MKLTTEINYNLSISKLLAKASENLETALSIAINNSSNPEMLFIISPIKYLDTKLKHIRAELPWAPPSTKENLLNPTMRVRVIREK